MATQKAIGPSFTDELVAAGNLIGQHFTWSSDGTIEFFDDTPAEVVIGVNAVYAAHDPTKGSVIANTGIAIQLRRTAALAIVTGTDAEVTAWKAYVSALDAVDLTALVPTWPTVPTI